MLQNYRWAILIYLYLSQSSWLKHGRKCYQFLLLSVRFESLSEVPKCHSTRDFLVLFHPIKIIKYRLEKGSESVSCAGKLLSGWRSGLIALLFLSVSFMCGIWSGRAPIKGKDEISFQQMLHPSSWGLPCGKVWFRSSSFRKRFWIKAGSSFLDTEDVTL